jgi:hypothetical protein
LNYIVYGLRIGFEETSIVQRKHGEAFIPSMASHRSLYADHPELRRFNALERMKQEHGRMGLEATSDLRASTALREAIHEYDHETDKERLAAANSRFGPVRRATPGGGSDPRQSGITATSDAGQTRAALPDPRTGGLQGAGRDVAAMDDRRPGAGAPPVPSGLATPQGVTVSMSVGEPVEPGDVVAFDPERPGTLRRSAAADLGLAGVVAEDSPDVIPGEGPVSVTVVGIAMCKVDAAYGAIKAGDPLVASPTPGHAMRSLDPAAGAILGKAIDSLDAGTGRIRVLVLPR